MELRGEFHVPAALPQYPLDRRLGGPQSWSQCCGEEKNFALLGIKPIGCSYITSFVLFHVISFIYVS
jgi:hypothetical protein